MALIRKETGARCWYLFTNGLLEYRDGGFHNAIEFLEKVETDQVPAALCMAAATLSMAYAQLGYLETADAHLKRARVLMAPHWPKGEIGENLSDWLGAEILIGEAELVLERAISARDSR